MSSSKSQFYQCTLDCNELSSLKLAQESLALCGRAIFMREEPLYYGSGMLAPWLFKLILASLHILLHFGICTVASDLNTRCLNSTLFA